MHFNAIQKSLYVLSSTSPHSQILLFICSYTETGMPWWNECQLIAKNLGGERSNHAQYFWVTAEPRCSQAHGAHSCDCHLNPWRECSVLKSCSNASVSSSFTARLLEKQKEQCSTNVILNSPHDRLEFPVYYYIL